MSLAPVVDVLIIGTSVTITATDLSTGKVLPVTWASSDQRIASMLDGRVTGVGTGVVTVTATYGQTSATITIKVVPDYRGTYQGGVFVVACVDVLEGFCFGNVLLETLGRPPEPFMLTLDQVKDSVAGRLVTRADDGPVNGQIDANGRLSLTGTLLLSVRPSDGPAIEVQAWSSYLSDPTVVKMYGSFNMSFFQVRNGLPAERLGVATSEIRGIDRRQ